jgi:hypothetical protein
MENKDFELSEEELVKLNTHIQRLSLRYREVEQESISDITISFEFVVPYGRFVKVSVSGSEFLYLEDVE